MWYAGFIYEWTNIVNGMRYLGSHCGNVDDGYTGSGKRFSNAVNKYGIEQFSRIIIEYVIFEDAVLLREQHYLDTRNCAKSKQYYNISPTAGGGDCGNGNKISRTKKKRYKSGELVIHNKGVTMSEEQKLSLIDTWEVITPNQEMLVVDNMLEYCRQHKLNPSAMSAVARGNRRHYKGYKCRKLTNNRNVEYKPRDPKAYMTKEERSKQLRELAVKGSAHHEAVAIKYNGVTYGSIAEAKAATNKSYYLLTKYGERVPTKDLEWKELKETV